MIGKIWTRVAMLAAVAVLALGIAGPAGAVDKTGGAYNTLFAGIGIKGYDPVAYHTVGKPTPGSADITYDWGGVTWRFASAGNRDLFKASPEKFAPQYGGFCSWGVSQGKLFDIDPVDGWTIADHKLYITFNKDVLGVFNKDQQGFIKQASSNWPKLNQ